MKTWRAIAALLAMVSGLSTVAAFLLDAPDRAVLFLIIAHMFTTTDAHIYLRHGNENLP